MRYSRDCGLLLLLSSPSVFPLTLKDHVQPLHISVCPHLEGRGEMEANTTAIYQGGKRKREIPTLWSDLVNGPELQASVLTKGWGRDES